MDKPPTEFVDSDEEEQSSDEEALVEEDWNIDFKDLDFESVTIGVGSFGKVIKGSYFGTPVALKKLYNTEDKFIRKYITRELNTLKNIHHPNIVQFMGLCVHETGVYIVTEFVPGGDLAMFLDAPNTKLAWKKAIHFCIDVAQAMAYLHARKIIHRDLKTSNLLVAADSRIKVCDFGMARKKDETMMGKKYKEMTICGSDHYMAPEVIMGFDYDFQADVFSYGLCLYEIVTRKIPVPRKPIKMYAFDVVEFKNSMPNETPQILYALICECCETEPRNRIPFRKILKVLNQLLEEAPEEPINWKSGQPETKKSATKTMKLKSGDLKQLLDDPEEALIGKMTIHRIGSNKKGSTSPKPPRPSTAIVSSPKARSGQMSEIKPSGNQPEKDIKIGGQRSASVSLGQTPLKKLSKDEEVRLLKACSEGDLPYLKSVLMQAFDLNVLNKEGESPLFVAVKYGHTPLVQELLPYMTTLQINTPTKSGSYPLHQACRSNVKEICKLLIDGGAKLKSPDKNKNYPIHLSCEAGSPEVVQLLLDKGGKILLETCNEQGETPLLVSYRLCHRPLIAILLKNQAHPWVVDRDGKTPLFYAVKHGDLELVAQLVNLGAELDHNTDDIGSPLELAIKEKQKDIAALLLKGGATIKKKNKLKKEDKKFLDEILASMSTN